MEIQSKIDYLLQFYTQSQIERYAKGSNCKISELYECCQPQEVEIASLAAYRGKLLVSSPDGFVPVKSLVTKNDLEILEVRFVNGMIIKTSPFHMFETPGGVFLSTANLRPGIEILTSDGVSEVVSVIDLEYTDDVYDLAVDHMKHRYYTAGLSSHNSGAGKSLFLQNLAVNWAEQGLNVVYITLELSESLTSMRMDSMISGHDTRSIMKNIDDVAMRVKVSQKKHKGTLQIKYMSSGSSTNDIRSFVKEYEIQRDLHVDGILVDYLDLCSPVSVKVSPSDQFIKDKYVSEELRNIAQDLDVLMVSASQLNRSSYEEIEFNAANIAGGISKINTADNVIAIFVTSAMKDIGKYQVQFMKTRSSSGVGSKVDLSFSPTLRITDLPEGEQGALDGQTSTIMGKLKQKSVVSDTPPAQGAATEESSLDRISAIRKILKGQE